MNQYEGDWDDRGHREAPIAQNEHDPEAGRPLSTRQLEILRMYANLNSQKATAHRLGIAVQTLKNHLVIAYRRLEVDNQLDAFKKLGWLNPNGIAGHTHILTCYCGFTADQ